MALTPAWRTASSIERQPQFQTLSPPRADNEFFCGFNALGADEEWSKHQLHLLHSPAEPTAIINHSLPPVNLVGDLAVIEDDGSIIMPPNDFDLNKSSLLFTPVGNGYRVNRDPIAFTKNYGTPLHTFFGIDDQPLDNANNGYKEWSLGSAPFTFFGTSYEKIFIGTNGFITFTGGDTSGRVSAAALAAGLPRLAPLWADLDVTAEGSIYYQRLEDRHVITWDSAPQAQYASLSTFQLVLFDDGRFAFVYRKVKARNALTGISPGRSTIPSQPMDFSNAHNEWIASSAFESFSKLKRIDLPAFTRAFYAAQPDAFDTLYLWTDFAFDNGPGYATSFNVRNDIRGIGQKLFDRGAIYGSPTRLSSIALIGDVLGSWPDDPYANVVGLFSAVKIVCHEQGHRWLTYVRFKTNQGASDDLLGRDLSHWSFLMDSRTTSEGNFSSLMEGNAWNAEAGGLYRTIEVSANYFSELDQYLMGLRSPEEVNAVHYLDVPDDVKARLRFGSPMSNFTLAADSKTVTVEQIIAQEGARVPAAATAPKEFRIAFVLVTERGASATTKTLSKLEEYRAALVRYFSLATSRRGALNSALFHN
ncbi:MAG: hypothetical protein HY231_24590 [Acidobacteria bacterium]|nr:hypothetical protein [Acidobacteriota bacterium]